MVAIDNNYVDMVKFLLDHGAITDVEAEVNINNLIWKIQCHAFLFLVHKISEWIKPQRLYS